MNVLRWPVLKPSTQLERTVAERAEVFIGGLEIANGFSELNDAAEQEKRFKHEIEIMQKTGKPAKMPHKFLESVKNLPECAGMRSASTGW